MMLHGKSPALITGFNIFLPVEYHIKPRKASHILTPGGPHPAHHSQSSLASTPFPADDWRRLHSAPRGKSAAP